MNYPDRMCYLPAPGILFTEADDEMVLFDPNRGLGEGVYVLDDIGARIWQLTASQTKLAEQIGWAIRAVARRTPWNSNCLAQAITAKQMLQRHDIPSTLYLGVRKSEDTYDRLDAHAWVMCGENILTGMHQHHQSTIVSKFGDEL